MAVDDLTPSNAKKDLIQGNYLIEDMHSRIRFPFKIHGLFIDGKQVM